MYSEWVSISATTLAEEKRWSVLHKLPQTAGRDVVVAVVKPLAFTLGINAGKGDIEPSNLTKDKEVQWCMEVICFGLGLSLSEHDAIRDCVNIYCEWLLALTKPKLCVPKPVVENPNFYARKIVHHLYNLFLPRPDNTDIISRQAVLCHRVLRTIETVAQESNILERETWDELLLFLLAINDTLLTPPFTQDDISNNLCERILDVMFKVWLLACNRCFPTPPLWKTFREMCCSWRHRIALVAQWNRVNLILTARVLQFMYGPQFPDVKISEEDSHLVPADMTNECIAQAWFRFLHTLGNPVDMCHPEIISQTPKFYHFALTSEMVIDPCQHPCLSILPQIFSKAMKGVATLIDVFLGIAQFDTEEGIHQHKVLTNVQPSSVTPPHNRKGISKGLSGVTGTKASQRTSLISGLTTSKSNTSTGSHVHQTQSILQSPITTPTAPSAPPIRPILSPARPKCNSILHLFGSWLFEASLAGSDLAAFNSSTDSLDSSVRRPSSLILTNSQSSTPSMPDSIEIPPNLTLENFESGQAEAVGALCRIFCAKRTGEEILPVYLARFYLAVQYGLSGGQCSRGQILSSILVNSCDLLRQDLDGAMVLVPHFLQALELVLPERDLKIQPQPNIPQTELRHASIHILLSMLTLPLHFHNLPIKDISPGREKPSMTFHSLKIRLFNLLINALQVELDSTNTHMLLGGLLLCIQDAAASEEVDQVTQPMTNEAGSGESVCSLLRSADPEAGEMGDTHECSSLGHDLDILLSADFPTLDYDSTHASFLRATYLICHRLISSWKTDLNVSLAALEVLSGLARIHLPQLVKIATDSLEGKRAVKWICDYIVFQCSRPPPAHSRDLHSTIVAAYQCVTTWLIEHPDLLQDKDTVNTVLEVVELGISGSKSQPKITDPPVLKGNKELKPASMRVKDAAEAVLACMLDHVGYFPPPYGPENLSSLLDEQSLLQHCNSWNGDDNLCRDEAVKHFRYFVTDNSTLLALLEQHLGNDQDPQPTVTALIRGPFGRHAWAMQLRHLPRHKSGSKHYAVNPGRPLPISNLGMTHNTVPRYFPEAVERITTCKGDKSIPSLESIISEQEAGEHKSLEDLIDEQILFEENIKKQNVDHEYLKIETECKAPSVCQEFQTSRLILSHLGSLTLEALKESITQPLPSLITIDQTTSGFHHQLEILDGISSRTNDTVFIFYVKSGQTSARDILENVMSIENVHPHFMEFLRSLGWPVDVSKHAGWTGHTSTANKVLPSYDENNSNPNHGGNLYNGEQQILYWSDASSEIAFVVPSTKEPSSNFDIGHKDEDSDSIDECRSRSQVRLDTPPRDFDRRSANSPVESSRSSSHSENPISRTMSLSLDSSDDLSQGQGRGSGRKYGRQQSGAVSCDIKVLVVWLENLEDHLSFPLGELLPELTTGLEQSSYIPRSYEKDTFVIYIHALQSGLFRIKMQGPVGRMSLALPLVDGMVVSRRTLGNLVRQTALNMCRRRRLEAENCQPPHVKRRLKIQEIVSKYRKKLSEPEFYTSLFSSSPSG